MSEHLGTCLCGTVTFTIQGDFDCFYLCHCRHCQKDTGSAHGANLFSQSAQLTWLSGAQAVTSFTLNGTRHSKSFCQHCGSALPNTQAEGMLVVPAGCLDTPVALLPSAHLFCASKAAWETDLDRVPCYEKLPQ
ncbi:GFA family protein [Lacimicrobium sp. SS2-24]|uniref:GFA family protein n=1 Tax=Lacimicrobium sp. SS2-24 TaxID=2005569 RepID=UPI000B4BDDEB|nr:GFA family protein [Lacimicrobium sp. SS2-24]